MELVVIRKGERGIYGEIIPSELSEPLLKKENFSYNDIYFLKNKIEERKKHRITTGVYVFIKSYKLEFCLIEKAYNEKVNEGQLWKAEVIRTFLDKRNKEVKILKPIELVHYHSSNDVRNIEEKKFLAISLYWKEELETHIEKKILEKKDELFEAYTPEYTLRTVCPYCGKELQEKYTLSTTIVKEPTAEQVLEYWLSFLGEEWKSVVNKFYKTRSEEYKIMREYEEERRKIRNEISRLKNVGITIVPYTEEERKNYYDNLNKEWYEHSFFGGEPEDNPPPKYYISVTNPDAYRKAQQKIEELEETSLNMDKAEKETINAIWKRFREENKEIYRKCRFLLDEKLYPVIYEAIYNYDPYFFEFADLKAMDEIDAVLHVIFALENYIKKN
ncbi:MAG: hypothetical protein ACO2O6_06430 [Candidatus Hydrothermia bacterium]|jgi:hypothetical protein